MARPRRRRNANALPYNCPTCGNLAPADGSGNLPEACPTCGAAIPYFCRSCRLLVAPTPSGALPDDCPNCGEPVVFARLEGDVIDADYMPPDVVELPPEPAQDWEEVQREIEMRDEPARPGPWSPGPTSRRRRPVRPPEPPKVKVPPRRRGRWPTPNYAEEMRGNRRWRVPVCSFCEGAPRLVRIGSGALRCPTCSTVFADPRR